MSGVHILGKIENCVTLVIRDMGCFVLVWMLLGVKLVNMEGVGGD